MDLRARGVISSRGPRPVIDRRPSAEPPRLSGTSDWGRCLVTATVRVPDALAGVAAVNGGMEAAPEETPVPLLFTRDYL